MRGRPEVYSSMLRLWAVTQAFNQAQDEVCIFNISGDMPIFQFGLVAFYGENEGHEDQGRCLNVKSWFIVKAYVLPLC